MKWDEKEGPPVIKEEPKEPYTGSEWESSHPEIFNSRAFLGKASQLLNSSETKGTYVLFQREFEEQGAKIQRPFTVDFGNPGEVQFLKNVVGIVDRCLARQQGFKLGKFFDWLTMLE